MPILIRAVSINRPMVSARGWPMASNPARRNRRQAGYSLLEVLIAMAILALAVALSIPSMSAMYERHQVRQAFAALNAWVLEERTSARLAGHAADHPAGLIPAAGADMPDGWTAELLEPWRIHPSSACATTRIRIASPRDRIWDRSLEAPACRANLQV